MLKVTPEVNYTTKKKSNDTTDNLTKTSRVTSHSNSELLSRAKDLTEGNKITIIAGNFIDETQRINDSNKLKQESKSSVDTISKSDIKINILKQYRTQTDKYIEHEEKPQLNHFNHCRFILKNILGDKKLKNYQEKTSLSFFMKIKKERKNDINSLLFKFFSLFKSYNIQNETIITNNFSIIRNFKDDDKFSDDKINEDKSKDKNDQTPLFDLNLKKAMNENILNYYNPIREHSKIDEKIAEKLVNVDRFKKFRKNIIYNGEILDEDLNLDLCKEIEEDIRKIVKDILDQNFKENRYNEQKKTFQISQKKLKKLAKLEKKSKLLNESHIYLYICEYISEKFNTFFDATYQKTDEFWNCTDEIFLRLGNKQKLIWKDINKIVDKNIQKEKAWSEHYLKKLIINLKKYGDPNNSRYFANISSSFAAEESLEILFMKFRELKIDEITEKIIPEISSSCSDEYLTTLIETNNNIVILYSLYKLMLDEEEKSSLENDFLYYCYYYNYSKKKYFEFQNLHLQEIKSWDQKKKEDKNDKEETEDIAEQNKDGFVKNENNSGEEEKKTKVIINEADQKKQRKELLEGTRKLFQHMSNGMQEYKLKMSKLIKDFQELVEKIFDGDLNCLIFCRKPDFQDCKHFLNLHPMIAGIIGFYDKLKTYKKERDCFYTDEKLPKITFINFDGYDDRSNYYFARNLAKNLQIISIVFDGEKDIIEAIDHTVDDIEKIRHKKHFYFIPFREATQLEENQEKLNQKEKKIHEASEKETKQEESKTKEKKKYEINSKCLLKLFEKIVFKLIEKYSPSAIVLSHSFCFSNTINENGLSLSPKTFSKIIRKLCLLSNYKLIIFPNISFKSENISPDEKYNNWKNKFSFENNNSLNDNRKYIYEMLGATISAINRKN